MKKLLLILTILLVATASKAQGTIDTTKGFGWGVDASSMIDLTGHDMSTLNIDAYIGYRSPSILMAGIGAGIDMMVSNDSRSFPVYAIFRTSFSSRPRLLFFETHMGGSVNHIYNENTQTGFYGSWGIGIHLATGKKFRSYFVLSYNLMTRDNYTWQDQHVGCNALQFAGVKVGACF
ncbi:MAG: hypothetical protein LIP02_06555 [Bacteroidales bacterium]|nr:hypothetical protein [Bacteroidales bacterium]